LFEFAFVNDIESISLYLHSYGGKADDYPHPELDLSGFMRAVSKGNKRVGKVFDPVSARPRDWIDEHKLNSIANPHKCIIS
jgi:hypothetical protein